MRKLVVLVLVLVIVAGLLSIVDVTARAATETSVAHRIQGDVPGSQASVQISSFPFLGRLAASGNIPEATIDITNAAAGPVVFDHIHLQVHDLKVGVGHLLQRRITLESIRSADVTAEISQASLSRLSPIPITIGAGTVGVAGIQIPAQLSVAGNRLVVTAGAFRFPLVIPVLVVLPCMGGATLVPGAVDFSCQTTSLPSALAGAVVSF
ncbi:MAG: hypothetical protein ACRD0H_00695 [Actinomycetes bacterium]